jgi:hypothetical protein
VFLAIADRPRSTVCRSSLERPLFIAGASWKAGEPNTSHETHTNLRIHRFTLVTISSTISKWKNSLETHRFRPSSLGIQLFGPRNLPPEAQFTATPSWVAWLEAQQPLRRTWVTEAWRCFFGMEYLQKKGEHHSQNYGKSQEFPLISQKWINIWMFAKSQIPKMGRKNWILPDFWLVDDGDWWMITCTEISLLRQSCIVCGGWNHQHTHLYIYTYVNHMYMIIYEHQATPFWRLKIS